MLMVWWLFHREIPSNLFLTAMLKAQAFPMMPVTVRRGDQIVTRVIWLENTNANDLIPALTSTDATVCAFISGSGAPMP